VTAYVPAYRVCMVREGSVRMTERPALRAPDDAGRFFLEFYRQRHPDLDREAFAVACLDVRCRVIACETVCTGCLSATLVHPREVFTLAVLHKAAAIAVAHNHPSGDAEPSTDDIRLTQRLAAAGVLMGVDVLDHIVVGDGTWVSLKQRGHLLR